MHIYTLILNTYEFIDKIPEKLQGEKRAKTGKNRSKCVSFFVDGISETLRLGLFEQNGEKNQIEFISEYPGRIISENPGHQTDVNLQNTFSKNSASKQSDLNRKPRRIIAFLQLFASQCHYGILPRRKQ